MSLVVLTWIQYNKLVEKLCIFVNIWYICVLHNSSDADSRDLSSLIEWLIPLLTLQIIFTNVNILHLPHATVRLWTP